MPATHLDLAHALERAERRYQDDVAAAMARLRAAQLSVQRQCGAEPGHIFAALCGSADPRPGATGRPPLKCVVCNVPCSAVSDSAPNQPPREITT